MDPEDGPLAVLAQALRVLREDCGNPTYRTLQRYACIPHQRLAEAARGERLPSWPVIEGYVTGCRIYYQDKYKERRGLDGAGDLPRWQQLYRNASGDLPEESQPIRADGERVLVPVPAEAPVKADQPSAHPALRHRRITPAGIGHNRRRLAIGAVISGAMLLAAGVVLGILMASGRHSPATGSTVAAAPAGPGTGILVAAPASSCGRAASDGFRSPAATAFSDIQTVYTVKLEGLAASVMEGTYNGNSYDWLEAHPSGSKAGMQLRWSNAPGKWYYCTATLPGGNISALPDLVATVAVPVTIDGHRVIYQACVWHQHPYTDQCSPTGI
ncbi:MAG: hypothetical protein JO345_32930 [Streptosporangiaceae bacterium]|nr:hypothetical protein [Streptosporangiaceae bacterium]